MAAPTPTASEIGELVSANTDFRFDLFAELADPGTHENVVMSPLSVSMALAMTYNGAGGETQRAMAKALGLTGMELSQVNQANQALLQHLAELNPEVEISIANSIWAREGVEFYPSFLERTREHLGAQITPLDFGDPQSVDIINGWVDENTKGKIKKIIDSIEPAHVMFLINTVYFNGQWWLWPFDKSKTTERTFHLADGREKQHPMMSRYGKFLYLAEDDFQAVRLPYAKPQVAMYVFLPDSDSTLGEFLGSLSLENWSNWMSRFIEGHGDIVLPRFKSESEHMLNDALKALGMGIAFGPEADFSAMGPDNLWIDEARHKAIVEVNEEGTEAAAVTSAVAVPLSGSSLEFDFMADRPFFFAIRDDLSGAILFMGAVFDPEE